MSSRKILFLLDELRSIAQLGLNYSKDNYDRERYERLLELASHQYEELSSIPASEIEKLFRKELGYITPKVGVSASIFDDKGHQLLVRRTDDFSWCLPCGWAEVGETPEESLQREVVEETGLEVQVINQIRLGSRMPGDFNLPHTTYHLQFHCVVTSGSIRESHETTDIGYYDVTTIHDWHLDHKIEADTAQDYWSRILSNG